MIRTNSSMNPKHLHLRAFPAAFLFLSLIQGPPAAAQDAAVVDRNPINSTSRTGLMGADSPVKFPGMGKTLPALYPPDEPVIPPAPAGDPLFVANGPDGKDILQHSERIDKGFFLFSSPCRSLKQVKEIRAKMPQGSFEAPPNEWEDLGRTRRTLEEGGKLHIMAVGDSILNDAMRSGWIQLLREAYPKAEIVATVLVRGGGGCQHFRDDRLIGKYVVPRKPDLVLIGGISQRDTYSTSVVIDQIQDALPQTEILLMTGAFGISDPRNKDDLYLGPHSGTGLYGPALRRLAQDKDCAFLDMTRPWADYIVSSKLHPHLFYRDPVHANEYGEQVMAKILMSFFVPKAPEKK